MPNDDISQAPEEAITPEEQVQETATEEVSPQEEPQTEKPLTAEEYRKIAREEAIRAAQSQMAKGENRINQRIQERFAALESNKSVLKLTDEQVVLAQEQIINEEQRAAFAPRPSGQQASGPQGQALSDGLTQQVEFVYGQIDATFKDVGVDVTANDVEYKTIETALNDPNGSLAKTIRAAAKAAEAKTVRLEAQKKNAAARVLGGGSGTSSDNAISSITDSKTLYKLGEKKVSERK